MNARRQNHCGTLINKGEGKPWLAKWVYDKKTYFRSTGEVNKKKAMKKLEEFTRPFRDSSKIAVLNNIEAKIKTAENEIEAELRKLPGIKISELGDKFENSLEAKDIEQSTLSNYLGGINWLEKNVSKDVVYMKDVSKEVAEQVLVKLADDCGIAAYNLRLNLYKRLWKMFGKEGKVKGNVWEEFKKRKGSSGSRRILTTEELSRLYEEVKNDSEMKTLFMLGIYTGLRISDCSELKWSSVDMIRGVLNVVPKKTKKYNPDPIMIPMHNCLMNAVLERWRLKMANDEYVMPHIAQMHLSNSLAYKVKQVFEKCGIQTSERLENGKFKIVCGFHSLRHTFVSLTINSGMSPLLIQRIVGHSNISMTEHYFHSNENAIAEGISKMPLIG